jgi:hypothetical protein
MCSGGWRLQPGCCEFALGHRPLEQGRGGLHLNLPGAAAGLVGPVQGESIQQLGGALGRLTGGEGFQHMFQWLRCTLGPCRLLDLASTDFVLSIPLNPLIPACLLLRNCLLGVRSPGI